MIAGYDLVFRSTTPEYDGKRSVNIRPETNLEGVAEGLVDTGILKKSSGFVLLGKLTGWGSQIKAGHYEFEMGVSNRDVLETLRRGLQEPVRVRVPAGTRKERMIRSMAAEMAFTEEELTSAFSDEELATEMSTDTTHLWSFMIPDTYFFYWLTDPADVVRRIKDRYDNLYASALDSLGSIPVDLTPDEVIRAAGIVEWESSYVPEKPRIAGVYLNRLKNRWALQADPTVQYIIMLDEGEKRRLFFRDYEIDHPYNTYKFRGLPPGPITNPTASSIQSIFYPEAHSYFYFVAKGDGQHIFSKTLAEHRRNAQEYYRVMRMRRAEQAAAESASSGS